jgi:hypothetical protein
MKVSYFSLLMVLVFIGCQSPNEVSQEGDLDKISLSQDPGPYTCDLEQLGIDQNLGSPTSIADVIELVNALPRPLNIPCFLSSLNRPLKVNITNSGRSAQPAMGDDNPRVFIMNDPLVISISVKGGASQLMEFAEFTTDQRSIKGELKFPITEQVVDLATPFIKIESDSTSTCVGCHLQETKVTNTQYPGDVYESLALKPEVGQKIEVSDFRLESYKCELLAELDYRCHMIYGIYNHGEVTNEDFPATTLTFFESFSL